MQNVWLITNPGSGSTSAAKCDAIAALFADHGVKITGHTDFPDDDLPSTEVLDAAEADTVVLFAGDGTINAALCFLASWDGGFLILPGGTMNLLARTLHDSLDPSAIVAAAIGSPRKIALPVVEAGPHRAFVGLILGPAAHWFRAREAARNGRMVRLVAAMRFAWRRTFGHGIRVAGTHGLAKHYQAIFVRPGEDGLDVTGIDARDWRAIANLGWTWMTGEWIEARSVTKGAGPALKILGHRPVLALFDGEPEALSPGTQVTATRSKPNFIATRKATP